MELVQQNRKDRLSPEYELLDTGIFKDNRYFDCYIEYAKEEMNDILMKITVYNRGPEASYHPCTASSLVSQFLETQSPVHQT